MELGSVCTEAHPQYMNVIYEQPLRYCMPYKLAAGAACGLNAAAVSNTQKKVYLTYNLYPYVQNFAGACDTAAGLECSSGK